MKERTDRQTPEAIDPDVPDATSEWLSLSEASKHLGVHYTTLRAWSDAGEIPVFRTPGGHRRFRHADLRRFLVERLGAGYVGDSHELVDVAILRTRQQIQEIAENSRWLQSNDEQARDRRRQRGRQLFSLAISFVIKKGQRERILADGRALGNEYGAEAAEGGVGLAETGQAVQFFRRQLVTAIHEGGDSGVLDSEDVHIQRLINQFIDEVLFSVLEGYERSIKGAHNGRSSGQIDP